MQYNLKTNNHLKMYCIKYYNSKPSFSNPKPKKSFGIVQTESEIILCRERELDQSIHRSIFCELAPYIKSKFSQGKKKLIKQAYGSKTLLAPPRNMIPQSLLLIVCVLGKAEPTFYLMFTWPTSVRRLFTLQRKRLVFSALTECSFEDHNVFKNRCVICPTDI